VVFNYWAAPKKRKRKIYKWVLPKIKIERFLNLSVKKW
jgi:hypothetical protein